MHLVYKTFQGRAEIYQILSMVFWKINDIIHGPLLLDRSVCLPLFAMWPSFGYFSTVI